MLGRNLFSRLYWVADTLRDHWWMHKRLGITESDLVLDVGSGSSPDLRSNVLCDKFVVDGTERHGGAILRDRPLVVGDVERLPFKSGAFDYVICSHVLEHVSDPAQALSELGRVANRGYIETPSAEWELVAGFPFHRWRVSSSGGGLVFQPKSSSIEDPRLSAWFSRLQSSLHVRLLIWFFRRRLGVYTSLVWDGEPRHRIVGELPPDVDFDEATVVRELTAPAVSATRPGTVQRVLRAWSHHVRRRSQPRADLSKLICCPVCHEDLQSHDDHLTCGKCGLTYPIGADGVPWLLVEMSEPRP
jgi:uncharacterized protein YbaR (Trm112 family)/SAM-dependent methyltransferase